MIDSATDDIRFARYEITAISNQVSVQVVVYKIFVCVYNRADTTDSLRLL